MSLRCWLGTSLTAALLLSSAVIVRAETPTVDECGGYHDTNTDRYVVVDQARYDYCKSHGWLNPNGAPAFTGGSGPNGEPWVNPDTGNTGSYYIYGAPQACRRFIDDAYADGAKFEELPRCKQFIAMVVGEPARVDVVYGTVKVMRDEVNVEVNGKLLALKPAAFLENDRTMVPMRAIFEALGATIAWDDATQTVTGTRGSHVVTLTIGSGTAWVDGSSVRLDVPAALYDDRTFVPARFVAEALGAKVEWNADTETVIITDGQ